MITSLFEFFWRPNKRISLSSEESTTLEIILRSFIAIKQQAFECSGDTTLLEEIVEANNLLSKLE